MSEPIFEIRDIEAGYGRAALVLRGLSVSVDAGDVVCLVGPNGAEVDGPEGRERPSASPVRTGPAAG
ncbi:MAG: hypothetical protein ACRDWI_01295 [Jiangellaceae bacterium]